MSGTTSASSGLGAWLTVAAMVVAIVVLVFIWGGRDITQSHPHPIKVPTQEVQQP